jgi:hypothetical protein
MSRENEDVIYSDDLWRVTARPLNTPGLVELAIMSADEMEQLWLRRYLYPTPSAEGLERLRGDIIVPETAERTRAVVEVTYVTSNTASVEGVAPVAEHHEAVAGFEFTVRVYPGQVLAVEVGRAIAGERLGASHPCDMLEALDDSMGHACCTILFPESAAGELEDLYLATLADLESLVSAAITAGDPSETAAAKIADTACRLHETAVRFKDVAAAF